MKTLVRKLISSLFLVLCVWTLNLLLLHLSPGDATSRYWGPEVGKEVLQQMRAEKGLDLPFYKQLFIWTERLLYGDLGYSWTWHRPVGQILQEAIPATLQLTFLALILNILLGCILGVIAALLARQKAGLALDIGSLILYATPAFWLALLAIYIFSFKLQWLPAAGMGVLFVDESDWWSILLDRIRHIVLPASLLGIAGAVTTMRYVRSKMLDVLNQPYILLAQAKGLSKSKVIWRHAFRNALLPVITQIGLYFPILLGGAFIIEVIFAWPGMGRVAYEAIFAKDYPVILAVNFLIACFVVTGNLIADVLYSFVDPRIRY